MFSIFILLLVWFLPFTISKRYIINYLRKHKQFCFKKHLLKEISSLKTKIKNHLIYNKQKVTKRIIDIIILLHTHHNHLQNIMSAKLIKINQNKANFVIVLIIK